MDAATENSSTFAQICVEVDASVPLVDDFEVEVLQVDGSSSLVTIDVSYQWRPPVCEVCKVFGHATTACKPPVVQKASSESLVQSLEETTENVGHAEDQWHLVERRKRNSPSRRNNSNHSSTPTPSSTT